MAEEKKQTPVELRKLSINDRIRNAAAAKNGESIARKMFPNFKPAAKPDGGTNEKTNA